MENSETSSEKLEKETDQSMIIFGCPAWEVELENIGVAKPDTPHIFDFKFVSHWLQSLCGLWFIKY